MGVMQRPVVSVWPDGGKYWEHEYEKFDLKAYVPDSGINGQVNNYTFRAPLFLVFEENRQSVQEAVAKIGHVLSLKINLNKLQNK